MNQKNSLGLNKCFKDEDNPIMLFKEWFDEANKSEINDANAFALGTIDNKGYPSTRIVLLKDFDNDGFVFYTNLNSDKSKAIKNNSNVSMCFYWKSLLRQIRVLGSAFQVNDKDADEYFQSRPHYSKIGAWASDQSEEIEDREILEQKIKELEKEFEGKEIPRPKFWGGYLIDIHYWEFWQGRKNRTHDRFSYSKVDTEWKTVRLSP